MALLTVGPTSTFATIADAMAASGPGDIILLEAGYSNETATVLHNGLTFDGDASSTGIVLDLGNGISSITLLGAAPINVRDGGDGNTIIGNDGDNVVTVTGGIDSVSGGGGQDRLIVDYRLTSGAVTGNSTTNVADAGGLGLVTIGGGFEDFTILTGSGADTITTGAGDDIIDTGEGASTVVAGEGANSITGGSGADTITAGDGGNFVDGGDGTNTITTGGGDDDILGGLGADTIVTGGGEDRATVTGGADTFNAGGGDDLLIVDYSASTASVIGGVTGGSLTGGYDGQFTDLAGNSVVFEATERFSITTGSGGDVVATGDGDDVVATGAGADQIYSGGGDDTINAGAGGDAIDGGTGDDTVMLSGNRADYDVGDLGGGVYSIADLRAGSPDGTDTVANVEFVAFLDGTFGIEALLNDRPVVDLDTTDGAASADDTNLYVEGSAASGLGTLIEVTDDGTTLERATVTITDPEAGDILSVTLTLPPGISVDTVNSTATVLILVGSASPGDYATALRQVGYSSSSNDPTDGGTNTDRLITVVVNDGALDSAPATMTMSVFGVNDEPTLTATALNPTFPEGSGFYPLFSSAVASTVEAGQTVTSMTLTVTGVTNGADEMLEVDGTAVVLTNGNSVLTTGGNALTVTVILTAGVATVTFSGAALSATQVQQLVEGFSYHNSSENPTDADRVVTITQLVDSGPNGGGNDNVSSPNIASTVNVNPANDAPINSVPGTQTINEDASLTLSTGNGNALSVSDADATTLTVILTVAHGTITLASSAGLSFAGGSDGSADATMTFSGTAAAINAALGSGLTYNPNANFNGSDSITLLTSDGGQTGGSAQSDSDPITVNITAINDAPVVIGDGTESATTIAEDTPGAGQTIQALFAGQYSDAADNQIPNGGASSPGQFSGIAVTANGSSSATGQWQYFSGGVWTDIGAASDGAAKLLGDPFVTLIRFDPAPDYEGQAPALSVHLIDNSLPFGIVNGQIVDISGGGATGGTTAYSTGTVVLSQDVTAANDAPHNVVPGTQSIAEDGAVTFSTGNANAISVSDVDVGAGNLTVTLSIADGALILSGTTGLAVSGDFSNFVTLTGSSAAINTALDGLVYAPPANSSGSRTLTVTTNDNGNTGTDPGGDPGSEQDVDTVTINVSAVNDTPVVTVAETRAATEHVAITIDGAAAISDSDLDARNGGNGDYAGATLGIANNGGADANDLFSIGASGLFTVSGSNLEAAGLVFATVSGGNGSQLNITFTSSGTPATTALANAVLESIQYTYTGDSPPGAGVDVAIFLDDGAPANAGQGSTAGHPAVGLDLIHIAIADVNNAPVTDLNGAGGGTSTNVSYIENGSALLLASAGTVVDPDSPDFDGGTLTVQFTSNGTATDVLVLVASGQITVEETDVYYGGVPVGTIAGGYDGSTPLTIMLNADATAAIVQDLVRAIGYVNYSDNPSTTARTVSFTLSDGDGETGIAVTSTVNVAATDDQPVANPDTFAIGEDQPIVGGTVFGDTGDGTDEDPDGTPIQITAVDGVGASVGQQITLASGALLTLRADGSFDYDPNGRFNTLTEGASGAVNNAATDTFSYTITGGATAMATVIINGIVSSDDVLSGDANNNTIIGTPQPDSFDLSQGGNDNVSGLGDDDGFYFGAEFTAADTVDGGAGTNDQIGLRGNYAGGSALVLAASTMTNVEAIVVLPGFSYNITTNDANVAAGEVLRVQATQLAAGQDLIFNGAAETNGSFLIFGGNGNDSFIGGAGNDGFHFGPGQFNASDTVNGGAGNNDQLALDGDYTITLSGNVTNVEALVLRNGPTNTPNNFNITSGDAFVANGQTMIVFALQVTEDLVFDGSGELGGAFRIYGGQGNDVLRGGNGNDWIFGGTGADTLTGGGGNDVFYYDAISQSNPAGRDGIQDFVTGDLIDLSGIDAISGGADDAFSFIGGSAFGNHAGELRVENSAGPIWIVSGDTDGDGAADFELVVVVTDSHPLTGTDFTF